MRMWNILRFHELWMGPFYIVLVTMWRWTIITVFGIWTLIENAELRQYDARRKSRVRQFYNQQIELMPFERENQLLFSLTIFTIIRTISWKWSVASDAAWFIGPYQLGMNVKRGKTYLHRNYHWKRLMTRCLTWGDSVTIFQNVIWWLMGWTTIIFCGIPFWALSTLNEQNWSEIWICKTDAELH